MSSTVARGRGPEILPPVAMGRHVAPPSERERELGGIVVVSVALVVVDEMRLGVTAALAGAASLSTSPGGGTETSIVAIVARPAGVVGISGLGEAAAISGVEAESATVPGYADVAASDRAPPAVARCFAR